MSTPTVDWTVPRTPDGLEAEGLRERKKRLMRQQLSDTATQMFLERGFDAVRVTDIAEACGVSEKTVFNYFPTKESLILDRLESTVASLRTGLAEPGVSPVQAALRILDGELSAMTSWLAAQDDPVRAGTAIRRFGALIQATPSLRAYQSDMMDQFTGVAAASLAGRAGMSPDDPEPQIAATALLGLWRIQFQGLSKYLDGTRTPAQVHQAVTADVHHAAQLINTGLSSFAALSRWGSRWVRWCAGGRTGWSTGRFRARLCWIVARQHRPGRPALRERRCWPRIPVGSNVPARGVRLRQSRRPSGLPARDLGRYSGPGDLPRVTWIRSRPVCWAMCEGQVSGPVSNKTSGGPERKPIGVFVLEDQEIVRRGIRVLLEAEPDIQVIGEASTASVALAQIPALRPAVAVLDVRLPDGDGVSVCREIRSQAPEVACLMLTAFSDDEALLASIMAGAAGYVLKQIRGSDLVGAVRMVASGRSLLDPRAASKAMARLRDEADRHDPLAVLTARERKILELIGDGLTNRQIGERLSVSVKTVKNYVSILFVKLGMKQRTQAAAYAARVFDGRTFELSQDMRTINRKP